MTEAALLKMANPKTGEGREVGYLMVRLATAHADQMPDQDAHVKRLEQRLATAIGQSARREVPNTPQPTKTISLDEAKARTSVLLASLDQ